MLLAVVTGSGTGDSRAETAFTVCASGAGGVQLTLAEASGIVAMAGSVVIVAVAGSTRDVVVVAVTLTIADGTETASGTSTNVLWQALEGIVTLLAAGKSSTLVLELIHSHGGESCGAVVGSLVVVNLVNRNSGVHNVGLDSLLLNNGLNSLVNVLRDVRKTLEDFEML
jgi:hypothetical protein